MSWLNWLFPWLENPQLLNNSINNQINAELFKPSYLTIDKFGSIEPDISELYINLSLLNYSKNNQKYIKEIYTHQYFYVYKLHTILINDVVVDFAIDNPRNYAGSSNRRYSIYVDGKLLFRLSKISREYKCDFDDFESFNQISPYEISIENYYSFEEIKEIYSIINKYLKDQQILEKKEQNKTSQLIENIQIQTLQRRQQENIKKINIIGKLKGL